MIGIDAVQITEVRDVLKRHIRHSQFFSLINIGSSLHHMKTGSEHLRGHFPVLSVIPKAGDGAGLVVVFPEQAVPRDLLQSLLPFCENIFQVSQIHFFVRPLV